MNMNKSTKLIKAKKNKTTPVNKPKLKNIIADSHFYIHPVAMPAYQIFCTHFLPVLTANHFALISDTVIDVIEQDNGYCFFDQYQTVALIDFGTQVTVRVLSVDDVDIEKYAWNYLFRLFLGISPINPILWREFSSPLPNHIFLDGISGRLTLANVLKLKGLKNHHYDYRYKKINPQTPHTLPSFAELIRETCHDD